MLRINLTMSLLLSVVATASALAQQPVTTDSVDISLEGPSCDDVPAVWVVMDGAEHDAFPATKLERCHWIAIRAKGTFDATSPVFSLRLGMARTGCKHATVGRKDKKYVAKLTFKCCGPAAHDVAIKISRQILITYTRTMSVDTGDLESGSCDERGVYHSGVAKILSVWFADEALQLPVKTRFNPPEVKAAETIRIHFGEIDPKSMRPLLIFNDASVTRFLNPPDDVVAAEQLLTAAREQRCRGKAAMLPLCSSAADDEERARFKRIGLDRIKVTVAR